MGTYEKHGNEERYANTSAEVGVIIKFRVKSARGREFRESTGNFCTMNNGSECWSIINGRFFFSTYSPSSSIIPLVLIRDSVMKTRREVLHRERNVPMQQSTAQSFIDDWEIRWSSGNHCQSKKNKVIFWILISSSRRRIKIIFCRFVTNLPWAKWWNL